MINSDDINLFAESFLQGFSKLKSAVVTMEKPCRHCDGNGEFSPELGHVISKQETCVKCKGSGGSTITINLNVTKEPIKPKTSKK